MTDLLLDRLEFPQIWSDEGIYPEAIRVTQEELLAKEPPGRVYGSEHYRYAAFLYYVKSPETKHSQLIALIKAASLDADSGMAQAAIIDLVSHKNCTEEVFAEAKRCFNAFQVQYFDGALLLRAYKDGIPSWKE